MSSLGVTRTSEFQPRSDPNSNHKLWSVLKLDQHSVQCSLTLETLRLRMIFSTSFSAKNDRRSKRKQLKGKKKYCQTMSGLLKVFFFSFGANFFFPHLFKTLLRYIIKDTSAQCLKITQNVAFEFFNFDIFHQFLSNQY